MRALGLDACRGGWMGILMDDGHVVEQQVFARFSDPLDEWSPDQAAVDIPIGLTNETDRFADVAARQYLTSVGGNTSTVFNAPPRIVIEAFEEDFEIDFESATALARTVLKSKGITRQTFGIVKKIHEVRQFLRHHKDHGDSILEIHPEVCFHAVNWAPLPRKASCAGFTRRLQLLRDLQVGLDLCKFNALEGASVDDVLDAVVAAWTAQLRPTALTALDGTDGHEKPQQDPQVGRIAIYLREPDRH